MTKEGDFGRFIILTGATASGKTEIKTALEGHGVKRLVTATTRGPRTNETGGIDYHFMTPKEFEGLENAGGFIETVDYGKFLYGTPKSELEPLFEGANLVTSTEIKGAVDFAKGIRENYEPDLAAQILSRTSLVFIGVESLQVARARFISREKATSGFASKSTRKDIRRRLGDDWKWWQEYKDSFDHVIVNKTGLIELAVNEVAKLYNE